MFTADFTIRSAAHDIRGYLASASLATEGLSAHGDAGVARHAARIARAIEKVVQICENDLTDLAPARDRSPMDAAALRAMLRQIRALTTDSADRPGAGTAITWHIADDLTLDCHSEWLFRALYNLVANATKAIRLHGGSRVTIRAASNGRAVMILVEDDGPGLPAEVRARLAHGASGARTAATTGGFGLKVAEGLARRMGGVLHLVRTSSEGTAFCLEFGVHRP